MSIVRKPWDEIFNLEDVGFQLKKLVTIQMHTMQRIGTRGRVEYLECILWWGRYANGIYYTHVCHHVFTYLHARLTTWLRTPLCM